ncbi:MAG: hypothetical protein H7067_04405 [Burkholderiales bacterium]|nr:hypothetical protein [Opitutaceae bacterium]
MAEAYGDLVDAWEFENEPDIPFFADNADVFAAYHKAVALGLAAGRRALGARMTNDECRMTNEERSAPAWAVGLGEERGAGSGERGAGLNLEYPRNPRLRFAGGSAPWGQVAPPERSLVLMAAPGLPPGPYFEQLLANGYLSYTEGFNYHYYGFAMDYAGVYSQFDNAVVELSREQGAGSKERGEGSVGHSVSAQGFWRRLQAPRSSLPARTLPVFLTEWGYSLLDGYEAQTVEGRVRQWRYFSDVAQQNERLRVGAPMAFLLRPFFEIKAKEFGLSMPADEAREKHYGWAQGGWSGERGPEGGSAEQRVGTGSAGFQPASEALEPAGKDVGAPSEGTDHRSVLQSRTFSAGGLTFTPADFGAEGVEPWMERIGERVGDAEASPALAWLLERAGTAGSRRGMGGAEAAGPAVPPYLGGRTRSGSRDWLVRTEKPSPVVMDFVAGADTKAVKRDHGYWLWSQVRAGEGEGAPVVREGMGVMVFYNLGSEAAEVTPVWPEWIRPAEGAQTDAGWMRLGAQEPTLPVESGRLRLAPGERREVAVRLAARADRLLPVDVRISADVRSGGARTVSRWASRFYALPNGVVIRERDGFDFSQGAAEANRALLLARPHAPEEPTLRREGRWLVTEGMRVEETDWGWRLHVEHFPGVALRPAVAELPLPVGWSMPEGAMLSYDYRLIDGEGAVELSAASADAGLRRQTGIAGNLAESYIRTATGNLFGTTPRLSPTADWRNYRQSAETLTMHFLGRTVPPWRFSEHKPAALVFFVRPVRLPAIFEVRNPQVIELEAGW